MSVPVVVWLSALGLRPGHVAVGALQTQSQTPSILTYVGGKKKLTQRLPSDSTEYSDVSSAWLFQDVNESEAAQPTLFQRVFGRKASHNRTVIAAGRSKYIAGKLDTENRAIAEVMKRLPAESGHERGKAKDSAPNKVAFMFMLMDGSVDWPEVWDAFFGSAPPDHYTIYYHQAAKQQMNQRWSRRKSAAKPFDQWRATDVPHVPNDWCALMGVEAALITEALKDPHNVQFVLLSHDTIPLKAFSYVHSHLALSSRDTSKFCFAERAKHQLLVQEQLLNELTRSCFFRDFYSDLNSRTPKHHQWVVLARQHAETVVRRASAGLERWSEVWEFAAPDVGNMAEGCSDEAVPAAALLLDAEMRNISTGDAHKDLELMGVEQQCLTLVQWHNCFRGTELELPAGEEMTRTQELEFLYENLGELMKFLKPSDYDWLKSPVKKSTNEFPHSFERTSLSYLKTALRHGFMFARKFPASIRVNDDHGNTLKLSDALPAMWDEVDEEVARKRVWTRTSFSGRPASLKLERAKAAASTFVGWGSAAKTLA